MALSTGTQAPDFTLPSKQADGLKEISLSAHRGKDQVVLLFFPLAFTSVCVAELCDVSKNLGNYAKLNAVVYGISVDSPFAQEAMAQKEGISFPLLSDFNKEVSKAYDVLFADLIGLKGVSKRSAFVINREGVITFSSSSDDPKQLPDFDAIAKALEA